MKLEHKQIAFETKAVGDDGTFSGYGSVFGNIDSYREIVAPGAFKQSIKAIRQSKAPLPALWQHNPNEPIGGYDVLEEDEHGLRVEGWLMVNEIPKAREAHALLQRRVVRGLSIGYYVIEDSFNDKDNIRTLKKLDLQEISIVTFPANVDAQVNAVKARLANGETPTLREFERHLREQGFSKSVAERIAAGGYKQLMAGDQSEALDDLEAALAVFRT